MKIFSLLICGNPGVGKTELARILHKTIFEDSKMIKINLDYEQIDKISDFRIINRMITSSLINAIDEVEEQYTKNI